MDYCTLLDVLGAIGTGANPTPRPTPTPYDDTVLAQAITHASRAIDRHVTGTDSAAEYFTNATLTAEPHTGIVTKDGDIVCFAHKPAVTVVTGFSYRLFGTDLWIAVADASVTIQPNGKITAWTRTPMPRELVMAKCTYTGGLGATPGALPGDIQRAAIVLSARYYREARAGLGDVIGMPDTGTIVYTKAMPVEVLDLLSPYTRPMPW
jgi:hypothetical protein